MSKFEEVLEDKLDTQLFGPEIDYKLHIKKDSDGEFVLYDRETNQKIYISKNAAKKLKGYLK